jgi:hypothetical protein
MWRRGRTATVIHAARPLSKEVKMAFTFKNSKGVNYYLHSQTRTTSSGKKQTLYFFAKDVRPGSLDAVPAGYQVVENKNGLPVLKKN